MYNMYYFVHNINNSMRNDHFFLTKVSPKKQKILFFRILADFGDPAGRPGGDGMAKSWRELMTGWFKFLKGNIFSFSKNISIIKLKF